MPLSISRDDTTFPNYVVKDKKYKGIVTSTITAATWLTIIQTNLGATSISPIAKDPTDTDTVTARKILSRKKTEISISFIPAT